MERGNPMPNQKDTEIHKPDGVFFEGSTIGHANHESKIRRRDGVIFPGEEIGYVDSNNNIRRPDGFIFKGGVMGQVKGAAAHDKDGIIFPDEEWGHVDEDGNILKRVGSMFSGLMKGKMRGNNKEGALAFYVLRFSELMDRFEKLEQEARHTDHKGSYIGKIRYMLSYVPTFQGLGDFDGLIRRLKQLVEDLTSELERNRRSKVAAKEGLISEAEHYSNSTEWKNAAIQIKSLQARWKEAGNVGSDEDALWRRFRAATDRFFERRTAHFEALDRERAHNAAQKEHLCSVVESLTHSSDLKSAVSSVKQLQIQWKAIGPAAKDANERLWDRFRHACDEVFSAARRDWEHRQSEYLAKAKERERKHEEWERKKQEWRSKMHDTIRAKRERVSRLRESIDHDEENISRWRDTIYNLHPGGRADDIRDSLERKISDVEDRIRDKEQKIREIENDIDDIESNLRS